MSAEEVQELKDKGNDCVRNGKFEESIIHYTDAIKLDPKNFSLYSNRSLSFLKIQQFYHAMQDAGETIRLNPNWAKGYFRRAEVEFATSHYSEALVSYSVALALQPDDRGLIDALVRATQSRKDDRRKDEQLPWLGAGVGIILGALLVVADQLVTNNPTLSHPILMALLTIAVAIAGYGTAWSVRYYVKCQRAGLLEPPVDLLGGTQKSENPAEEEEPAEPTKEERTHQRYTKAQARQRFKKGRT